MSKTLSLKLRDEIYQETEEITHKIRVPRNWYINTALAFYNKLRKRALLKKELLKDSQLVRDNSMEILETCEACEDDLAES